MINSLEHGIVDIYYGCIPVYFKTSERDLLKKLNAEEIKAYNKYRSESRKAEFLFGRSLVKSVLSTHLKTSPSNINLKKNSRGKLFIDDGIERCKGIGFNISHSGDMIACAVALDSKLGIDVEKTLKEASTKKKGLGLSLTIDSFNVMETSEIFLNTIEPKPGYYISVAVGNDSGLNYEFRVNEVTLESLTEN